MLKLRLVKESVLGRTAREPRYVHIAPEHVAAIDSVDPPEQKQASTATCPTCSVRPGIPCIGPDGSLASASHEARYEAANPPVEPLAMVWMVSSNTYLVWADPDVLATLVDAAKRQLHDEAMYGQAMAAQVASEAGR